MAATAAAVRPAGAALYLLIPAWLAVLAGQRHLLGLGLGTRVSPGAVALGGCLGAFLGGHMLFTATLTLGYQPLERGVAPLLGALAYDAGVQVPSTECFMRGALFGRAQRRWSFAAACALSTGAAVARYLVDPLLPGAVEMIAGAVFYIALLGVGNAWLRWRFGTLVPGLLASLLFFAAYRTFPAA
jgi:hypothetical protein